MEDRDAVIAAAEQIAAAIGRRDLATIRSFLAPGFIQRTHGQAAADVEAFLSAIEHIPGEILLVRLEQLAVDICATGALATGIQYAQVRLDGQILEDRNRFIDWFVKHDGSWRIQAAVDLPGSGSD